MSKLRGATFAAALCGIVALCAIGRWLVISPSIAALTADRDSHQFHATDSELTTTFRLRNSSRAPVEITSVKASCGCTSAKIQSTKLVPGCETVLTVSMDWPLAGTVETQVAVETNVSQSLPLILRVTAAAKSDDSRIVMIQPDTIRLNYEKCPERDLRIVTIENGTDASKRLELSCNLEGVSFALTGEKSHPLPDHTFSQFERTYRVRLPVGTVTGTQLGSISFRFGPTIGTAPLSRSMLIEVARQ